MEISSSVNQMLSLLWIKILRFETRGLLLNLAELDGLHASGCPVYSAKHLCS